MLCRLSVFLLVCLTYTYVAAMPLRPQEGHPVVHMNYQRVPQLPGLVGLKEQILVAAHQESMLRVGHADPFNAPRGTLPPITDDAPATENTDLIPDLNGLLTSRAAAVGQAAPSACVNGFQTYADTTWDLMGLPNTLAYTLQACIGACASAGTNCAAAVWYNGNACVRYTQTQTVGQIMTKSPDPTLPRTLITRCTTTTTTAPATQAPVTQAPATQAPATQAPATQPPVTSSGSCPSGFSTYTDSTYDLAGLPYTVAYTAAACMTICAGQGATCAAAVWYNGNACVPYTPAQAAGKVITKSPDPTLPRTLFVRCTGSATQAPATQAPVTQAPTKPATPAPTQAPATQAPATQAPATQAPATQAPPSSSYPVLSPDTTAPGSNGIAYAGGTVMTNPVKVYLVYYGSWTTTQAQQAINIINTFVTNLGASQWWNIQTSYYQPNPATGARAYVRNGVTLGGYAVAPTDSTNGGASLNDAQVSYIISNQIAAGKFPYSSDNVYIMISSAEVFETGFCSSDCGWHSAAAVKGTSNVMKYGWVGDASTQCPGSCTAFGGSISPNGNKGADGIISILAHEIAEAVSDPYLNAWRQTDYTENADKCAWNFGSTYTASNGGKANVKVGSLDYLVQTNWKNRDGGGCVLHL